MKAEGAIEIAKGRNDSMGLALMTLAQEMWVLKDRQMVVEALLEDKGLLAEVDRYQPTPEIAQRIAGERDRFIRAITTMMLTGKPSET